MMRWRSRNRGGDGASAPERGTPDILWQEKARRRSRGRVTRFFSPGWWLEGRRGAVALALFLVIGGGLVYPAFSQRGRRRRRPGICGLFRGRAGCGRRAAAYRR